MQNIMDHPNVSLRFANMEGSLHQSAFDGLKKLGDAKDYSADSGYITNMSMSNSAASSSRIGNLTGSSFKRSLDLAPISELHEFGHTDAVPPSQAAATFGAIETPTTKSIRQLSAFHISTPPPNRSETTPTKSNYSAQISGSGSSRKKSSHRYRYSPYKSNGQARSPRERRNLFDANNENECAPNVHEVTIGFSPIGAYDSGSAKMASPKNPLLMRHPSGIESSTPKASVLRRIQTQATVRPAHDSFVDTRSTHIIRKTQSFGPNQPVLRAPSGALSRAQPVSSDRLIEAGNPASLLKLSNEQFHQLLESQLPAGLQTPTKQQPISAPMAASTEESRQSPYKRKASSSRLLRGFTRKRTLKPATNTKPAADSLNESDILMALAEDMSGVETATAAGASAVDRASAESNVTKTPNVSRCIVAANKSDTPSRDDSMAHSLRIEANRTPIKRFDRSISFNPTHRRFSPEKEKNKIIYGHLPCTPPKNYAKRPLKRAANKSIGISSTPVTPEPSAKRKLYEAGTTRTVFYNDKYTRMDILTHLANFNLANITANIFNRLSERDLQATRSTCRSWAYIVQQDRVNDARRRQFVQAAQSVKENSYSQRKHSMSSSNVSELNNTHDVSLKRRPFNMSNIQNSVIEKTEPVNMSLLRFQENQEVSFETVFDMERLHHSKF